ncbi:MAG: DMT family transporter [Syntrophomonadaceae bacterium]
MPNLLYVATAALSGAAMALQGTVNTALGKVIGTWESTLVVHIIGALASLLVIMTLGIGFSFFGKMDQVPWYGYLGGILNVAIIYAVVISMSQIGVGNATTAIVTVQLITALLIDCTGAFGMKQYHFHYRDLLGVAMLAIGARILFMD